MDIYLLKLNLALVLLYGFYRLMASRDTFFVLRRFTLLTIYVVATITPFVNVAWLIERTPTTISMAENYAVNVLPVMEVYAHASQLTFTDVLAFVYVFVVVMLVMRFVWQFLSITTLAKKLPKSELNGVSVHLLKGKEGPFSFFGWIFVNPEGHTHEQLNEILTHEHAHVAQWHSVDTMVAEWFCMLCWFNPVVWLLRKEVRMNLEFLADDKVLAEGNARKAYQYHLLGLAYQSHNWDVTNNYNVLPLKARIKMMNKKRTKQIGMTKYLLFAPLTAALLLVSNIEMVARTLTSSVNAQKSEAVTKSVVKKNQTAVKTEVGAQLKVAAMHNDAVANKVDEALMNNAVAEKLPNAVPDDKVYDVVEKMPNFPGGMRALQKFIAEHIVYPKTKVEGIVIVSFVVAKDGAITDARVVRSVTEELDEAALKMVREMPKWEPGQQQGKPVAVRYTLPVRFRQRTEVDEKQNKTNAIKEYVAIVDGKRMDSIKGINPEEIESMQVLKDEASMKKYNSNGKPVIIIKLRKK